MILARSEETGQIELDEVEMIESVFELGETVAREVMVPRPDVETLPASTPLSELRTVVANGAYLVDGSVPVEEVNARLDAAFESDDVETIGEFAFSRLGRVAEVVDEIEQDGVSLRVDDVTDARIERLVIERTRRPVEADGE